MINEKMYKLGSKRSVIREIFEYAKKRGGEIGAENVFDFSIGNPSVPAPACVEEAILRIRRTGIDDVRLMGILYQTTFERIEALGDVIVAVSATRFDEADYSRQVARVKAAGLMCESHADKFVHFDRINRHDIDFVSTDFLAPDYRGQGRLLAEYARADGFVLPASADEGAIRLGEGQSIVPKRQLPAVPFGALYLELEAEGSARIELGGQTFTLDVPDKRTVTHQVLLHDAAPALRITALAGGITLTAIRAKVVAFEQ